MTKYYVPMIVHPHNFPGQGSCHFEGFLTIEELRKYHPEPMKYFTVGDE